MTDLDWRVADASRCDSAIRPAGDTLPAQGPATFPICTNRTPVPIPRQLWFPADRSSIRSGRAYVVRSALSRITGATAGGMADMDRLVQIERFDQRGDIVGIDGKIAARPIMIGPVMARRSYAMQQYLLAISPPG